MIGRLRASVPRVRLFRNPYRGMFDTWRWDSLGYVLESPDDRDVQLWCANGYSFLRDYGRKPFLAGLGPWQRWLIWREIKRKKQLEKARRQLEERRAARENRGW